MSSKLTPAQQLAQSLKAKETNDEKVVLHCEIRTLRDEAGLTQQDVARAVGTNSAAIGNVEAGSPPRLDIALRLAAFFGCEVEKIWSINKADDSIVE